MQTENETAALNRAFTRQANREVVAAFGLQRELGADCGGNCCGGGCDCEDCERCAVFSDRAALLNALQATLPALILLGDYIGNDFAGKVGIEAFDRCAIIHAARAAIQKATA